MILFSYSEKQKATQRVALYTWRRGRDSNPRVIAHKLISSQPRYDHFDTSADMSSPSATATQKNTVCVLWCYEILAPQVFPSYCITKVSNVQVFFHIISGHPNQVFCCGNNRCGRALLWDVECDRDCLPQPHWRGYPWLPHYPRR